MVTRLDAAYDAQTLAVRKKVVDYALRSWSSLSSYRDADADRLIAALIPRVEAGQLRIAQLTDAYIARTAATVLGAPIRRGAIADATTEALRGVTADEVYRRPFVTTYTKLSEGKTLTDSVAAGGARLASLVTTGMQLASTHAARTAMGRAGVRTYERELTGRENCALCVIASTQRYWRGDLLPIHPGCDCGVRTVDGDPGEQVIDPDLLERIHGAVEQEFGESDRGARLLDGLKVVTYSDGTRAADFTDLIVTQHHSEIGPVLTWRDQHFTGSSDI